MQLYMSNSYTEAEATTIFDIAVQLTPVAIHGNGSGAALSPLRTKIFSISGKKLQQECIPVRCVPPAC